MYRRFAWLICSQLLLGVLCGPAWAGENANAAIGMIPIEAGEDTLAYRVLVSGTNIVGTVHLEFSYDTSALEFVAWQDADFLHNMQNSLRIGPRVDDPEGTVLVAISSKQFRSWTSFDVGIVSFRRIAAGDEVPSLLRVCLVDPTYGQDWLVTPGVGGQQAPRAPTAVAEDVPVRFALGEVSPNPLIYNTAVQYDIPRPGSRVTIRIYDVTGRVTRTLVDAYRAPGYYSEAWDLTNDRGQTVAPGIYFCRMVAGNFRDTSKVILLN